jgi:hypothetical protein
MTAKILEVRTANSNVPFLLLYTIGLTFAVLMLASGHQVLDPMVRHDDFGALLADPTDFYSKTLEEGRWLSYWWHLRGWVTPAWANFAVYQFFWAIYAGAAAVNACGKEEPFRYVAALALMIVVSLPALLISVWFNTLLPGLGIVALFALLATFLRPATMRWLLLIFVPLTLMAYTTFPLLLLAVCLTTRVLRRSWWDLLTLLATFIISFALGLLAIYSLNYVEHGVFGISIADWRNPTPPHDLASVIVNMDLVLQFFKETALTIAFEDATVMVIHGLVLTGSLIYLARVEPWTVLYIFAGLVAGIGLLSLQIIMTGVITPARAVNFVWVLYSILCARVAIVCHSKGRVLANLAWSFLLITITIYLIWIWERYFIYTYWQDETRALALQAGTGAGPIYVIGSYKALKSESKVGIMGPRGLQLRLKYLTGRAVFVCDKTPDACENVSADALSGLALPVQEVRQIQNRTEIILPLVTK